MTTVVPGLMRTGSFLAAYFKGDRAALEYGLFAPLSGDAGDDRFGRARGAKRIVDGPAPRRPEITLGLHAKLAARANGIAPGAAQAVLSLVARALPEVHGTRAHARLGDRLARRRSARDRLGTPGGRTA